jgi:PAS domain S-box-containing protein
MRRLALWFPRGTVMRTDDQAPSTDRAGSSSGVDDLLRVQRDLALRLSDTGNLDEALGACLDAALRASGMDSGGIYLVDAVTGGMHLACSRALGDEFVAAVARYDADSLARALISAGRPIYAASPTPALPEPESSREGLRSIACLPVLHEGRPVACLNVASHVLQAVTAAQREALETLGAQMGSAITRIRAQQQLQQSEERYRFLADNLSDVVWTMNLKLEYTYVSPGVRRLRGFEPEEVLAQTIDQVLTPASVALARRTLAERLAAPPEGRVLSAVLELDMLCKDGTVVPTEVTVSRVSDAQGQVIGLVGVTRDISERRRAERERAAFEDQLRQSHKLEAIGTLAGGIAHDFNNLLGVVLGGTSLLRQRLASGSDTLRTAELIETAALRASELTRQLLGFARKGKLRDEPVDVHQVISEVVGLLSHTLDRRIRIETRLDAEPVLVRGDPGQIQQVFLNLGLNAADAMPEGGVLTIGTARVPEAETPDDLPRGRYVACQVADNGHGIPKEVQARVFEPFFTTKEPGKGTGLGLATVYGIAKNHGGAVRLESTEGRGTIVTVTLPKLGEGARASDRPTPTTLHAGSGHVLLVEDERTLGLVAERLLLHLGYTVHVADNGRTALEYFERAWQTVDLVILDLAMPVMDGRACFAGLREINPAVRVLLSTGHGVGGVPQELLDAGARGLLSKPYDLHQLGEAVAAALRD